MQGLNRVCVCVCVQSVVTASANDLRGFNLTDQIQAVKQCCAIKSAARHGSIALGPGSFEGVKDLVCLGSTATAESDVEYYTF